jgi:hypothetical protein
MADFPHSRVRFKAENLQKGRSLSERLANAFTAPEHLVLSELFGESRCQVRLINRLPEITASSHESMLANHFDRTHQTVINRGYVMYVEAERDRAVDSMVSQGPAKLLERY